MMRRCCLRSRGAALPLAGHHLPQQVLDVARPGVGVEQARAETAALHSGVDYMFIVAPVRGLQAGPAPLGVAAAACLLLEQLAQPPASIGSSEIKQSIATMIIHTTLYLHSEQPRVEGPLVLLVLGVLQLGNGEADGQQEEGGPPCPAQHAEWIVKPVLQCFIPVKQEHYLVCHM